MHYLNSFLKRNKIKTGWCGSNPSNIQDVPGTHFICLRLAIYIFIFALSNFISQKEQDQDRLCGSNPSFTHARRTGYTLSNKLLLRSTRTSNLIGPRGSIKLDQASGRQGQTATSRPMSCTLTVEVAGWGTLVGQTSTFVSST